MITDSVKIEEMLQQLVLIVAKTLKKSSVEAVGIVAKSRVGIELKDCLIKEGSTISQLSSRLISEVRLGL